MPKLWTAVGVELRAIRERAGWRSTNAIARSDIQQWFGHTSPGMTRTYTGMPLARLRDMAARLDGRLGWGTDGEPER